MIEIEAPDGSVVEFPEGTADDVIKQVMLKNYPAQQKQPEPWEAVDLSGDRTSVRANIQALPKEHRFKAYRRWQDQRVEKEREEARATMLGRMQLGVYDTIGQFSRGIPVIGGLLDELDAGTQAVLGSANTPPEQRPHHFEELYDENLAYARARDAAADKEATKIGELPVVGDVTTGGLTKLAGGIASAPVTPVVNADRGAATLPQMVNYGLTGAALGAGHGFADAEGDDRGAGADVGGMVGGGLGAAAPALSRGVSNAAGYVNAQRQRLPQPVSTYHPGAVRRVAESFDADGIQNPSATVQRNGAPVQLGDDAMLADLGENLRADTSAIANQPGAGRATVRRALNERRTGAVGRFSSEVIMRLVRLPISPAKLMR